MLIMKVRLINNVGLTHEVQVEASCTVNELQTVVREQFNVADDATVHMTHAGRRMRDGTATLGTYGTSLFFCSAFLVLLDCVRRIMYTVYAYLVRGVGVVLLLLYGV